MKIEDNNICFVRFFFASYEINCAKRMHNKMDGGWKKEKRLELIMSKRLLARAGKRECDFSEIQLG